MTEPFSEAYYAGVILKLQARILAMIPEHPEIMTLDSAWDLFKVPGFRCDDLGPSLAQATEAWRAACREYRANTPLRGFREDRP